MFETSYWNEFYKKHGALQVPSQFAAFSLAEMPSHADIIELGCGNGRDALFFARYGHRVIGIDKAAEAVETGQEQAVRGKLPARFICSDINALGQEENFGLNCAPLIVYSRFFLHSINEAEEAVFMDFCRHCLAGSGKLFLEFRTEKDEAQYKQAGDTHYRRFIRLDDFLRRAKAAGFEAEYSIEGQGFAKYGAEDAYVARTILKPAP